jgi:exodeoxyribonuclease VII large subunit
LCTPVNTNAYITLSQLTAAIQGTIRNAFFGKSFWVVADITGHSYYPAKGFHFFDLVEKDPHTHQLTTKVQANAWSQGTARIAEFERVTGQRFGNDLHVLIRVSVEYHPLYGLKLSLQDIDTSFTRGQLEQQKQATLLRLVNECGDIVRKTADGYFTHNKSLKLQAVVQRIAVISSPKAAGYIDFTKSLQDNIYGYTFHMDNYFATVQGEANVAQICAQLAAIKASGKTYDTVVIIRGGGAQTDLLLFEKFEIGKAVAGFHIPVIAGIGHEINETITDLMAHTSVKTPTMAAEMIISHNRSFEDALLKEQRNIIIRLQQLVSGRKQQLSSLHAHIVNRSRDLLVTQRADISQLSVQLQSKPAKLTASRLQDLTYLQQNIQLFSRQLVRQQEQQLQHHSTLIRVLSPAALLRKGFAMVYHNGQIVTTAENLRQGDAITVQLADAAVHATIQSKTINDGNESDI